MENFDELPLFSFLISIEEAHGAERDKRNYWSKSKSVRKGEDDFFVGTRICEEDNKSRKMTKRVFALLPILWWWNGGKKGMELIRVKNCDVLSFHSFFVLISLTYLSFHYPDSLTHPGKPSFTSQKLQGTLFQLGTKGKKHVKHNNKNVAIANPS